MLPFPYHLSFRSSRARRSHETLTSRALFELGWQTQHGENGRLIALGLECVCLLLHHSTRPQSLLRCPRLGRPCLEPRRGRVDLFILRLADFATDTDEEGV